MYAANPLRQCGQAVSVASMILSGRSAGLGSARAARDPRHLREGRRAISRHRGPALCSPASPTTPRSGNAPGPSPGAAGGTTVASERYSEYFADLLVNNIPSLTYVRTRNFGAPFNFNENVLRDHIKERIADGLYKPPGHWPKLVIEQMVKNDIPGERLGKRRIDYFFLASTSSSKPDIWDVLARCEVKGPTRPAFLKGSQKNWYPDIVKDIRAQAGRSAIAPEGEHHLAVMVRPIHDADRVADTRERLAGVFARMLQDVPEAGLAEFGRMVLARSDVQGAASLRRGDLGRPLMKDRRVAMAGYPRVGKLKIRGDHAEVPHLNGSNPRPYFRHPLTGGYLMSFRLKLLSTVALYGICLGLADLASSGLLATAPELPPLTTATTSSSAGAFYQATNTTTGEVFVIPFPDGPRTIRFL